MVATLLVLFAAIGLTPSTEVGAVEGRYIAPSFFGAHSSVSRQIPWAPTAFRLHSANTPWCRLNPAPGVYNWAALDLWLDAAATRGADLIYTFSKVPLWASTASSSTTAGCGADTDLAMAAPPDDAAWGSFVTELVRHAAGRIAAYELWNEPDGWYFTGTVDDMVRMSDIAAKVIRANDPTAKILTPSVTRGGAPWMQEYLGKVPPGTVDVVAYHGYPAPADGPEGIIPITDRLRAAMAATGYAGYPIWNTEGSWGRDAAYGSYADPSWQRAYIGRLEMHNISLGIERFYWYRYDGAPGQGWGTLWSEATGLTSAGVAMGEIVKWMSGVTLTAPCSASATKLWSCDISRPDGSTARVVWSQTGTQPYVVPPQWTTMRTLSGESRVVSGATTVSIEPVLFEPGSAPVDAPVTTVAPVSTTTVPAVAPQAPTAVMSGTLSGRTLQADGTASTDSDGFVKKWLWTWGDGTSSMGSTASHTYRRAGSYPVTLTVTDNRGAKHSTTTSFTVI